MKSTTPPTKSEQKKAKMFAIQSLKPTWITSELAAEWLGIEKRIIHDWYKRGEIIASRPNGPKGTMFVDLESVNRFLKKYSL